MKFTLFQ